MHPHGMKVLTTVLKDPEGEFGFRNGHLVSGDVISTQNFMISENHPGSFQMHWECFLMIPGGP